MKTAKRVLCAVLALALGLVLLAPGAAAEEEDPRIAEVLAVIEEYNATHGGTGALSASYKPGKGTALIWTITGEVTGATKGIEIPHSNIVWQATLIGETSGEAMLKAVDVSVNGGEIKTNGLAVEGLSVSIDQGSISGSEAILAASIMIGGGTVVGDARAVNGAMYADFIMFGGTFTGAVYCEDGHVSLSENAVANVTALSAKNIIIYDKAQLHFIENAAATITDDTRISIRAKITGNGAKAFLKNAVLYTDAFTYVSGCIVHHPFAFLQESSILQFILRWIFFPRAMLGF